MITKKYEKLAEIIKDEISELLLKKKDQLPPERKLAEEYNVSRQTVRSALELLEKQGYIISIQGKGSVLTGIDPKINENTIALIMCSDSEYIFPSLISEIKKELNDKGFEMELFVSSGNPFMERKILEDIISDNFLGLIIEPCNCAMPTPNYDLFEILKSKKMPIVFLHGFYSNVSDFSIVKDDNFTGAYLATEYLIQNAHKGIGGIFQADTNQGHERYLGYSRALIDSLIDISENSIMWFTQSQLFKLQNKGNTDFLVNYIKHNLNALTAIVCYNDEIAYYLAKELSYAKINVPGDISLIGFDNSYLSEISNVSLTTLAHKERATAKAVADTISNLILGKPNNIISLPWTLIERSSTNSIG